MPLMVPRAHSLSNVILVYLAHCRLSDRSVCRNSKVISRRLICGIVCSIHLHARHLWSKCERQLPEIVSRIQKTAAVRLNGKSAWLQDQGRESSLKSVVFPGGSLEQVGEIIG